MQYVPYKYIGKDADGNDTFEPAENRALLESAALLYPVKWGGVVVGYNVYAPGEPLPTPQPQEPEGD